MRAGGVPVREVEAEGCRLTGGFHLSEDQIAVSTLRAFPGPTSRVSELVHDRGVFRGPIFKRIYVEDPALGEPYVSARDLVMADVRPSSFLSRRLGGLIDDLRLKAGMILVTCSGMNLGSAIWTREDLDGLVASHDLIRICPNPAAVPPGYLYAFLASRYGRALIRKQIYGGSIKHVEPEHVAGLPVPRLGESQELGIHHLVVQSAQLRSRAARYRAEAVALVERLIGWHHTQLHTLAGETAASSLQRRLDAFYHTQVIVRARQALAANSGAHRLGDLVEEVFEPNRGARQKVDDPTLGVPFLSSSEVFRLDPVGEYLVSKTRTHHLSRSLVFERDMMLPRSGQIGGIIGKAVLPLPSYYGSAASEHLVRIRCKSRADAFYVFAVFASEPGFYAAIGTAFGSSIPSLDCELLADLWVPWCQGDKRKEIVNAVSFMVDGLAGAIISERKAVSLVETAIEAAT